MVSRKKTHSLDVCDAHFCEKTVNPCHQPPERLEEATRSIVNPADGLARYVIRQTVQKYARRSFLSYPSLGNFCDTTQQSMSHMTT